MPNGVVLSFESEQERLNQRIARHATVFLGKSVYRLQQEQNLSPIEVAAFNLRKILHDGQHEEEGISYFNSSEYGAAVLTYPGLVSCAISYLKGKDAAKKNAGRLLLEGLARMAGADIDKASELVGFLQTPDRKLSPNIREQVQKIRKILDEEGFSLPPARHFKRRPYHNRLFVLARTVGLS